MILRASSEDTDLLEATPVDALLASRAKGAGVVVGVVTPLVVVVAESESFWDVRGCELPADAVRFGTENRVNLDTSNFEGPCWVLDPSDVAGDRVRGPGAAEADAWVMWN
mmetsp:Transcript_24271/g.28264  ORF Transcript_24271/g.28264 Transcript_24271/m.28264 type:complete len:110 (-) Transcript_24271:233-562(-)